MARNIMHLGFGQLVTTALTILLSAIMAKVLSPPDFGLLVLITAISGFAYVVVDWGHGSLVVREAARDPAQTGDLVGSALVVRALAALLACPVALAATWLLGYDVRTRTMTGLMILALLPQYLGLTFCWAFRARERMDRDALLNILLKLSVLVFAIVFFALGARMGGVILAWGAAGTLTLVLGIAMYRKLDLPRLSASVATSRMLMKDGAPIFMMSVAGALEYALNANILYKMASPTVVGWFGAAWTIAGTLLAPGTVLCTAAYPRLSTAASDPVEFKRTFELSFRPLLLLAVLGGVGTYIFADVPVGLIYGAEKFGPAADILRAFAPVLLLVYIDLFLSMAIIATGRAGWISVAKAFSVVLTTVLVFILVPYCERRFGNGGLGVMYALAGGEIMMFAACVGILRNAIDGRTMTEVLRALVAGAGTVLLFVLVPGFAPVIGIPACVLAFVALALLFGAVKRSDFDVLLASFRRPAS